MQVVGTLFTHHQKCVLLDTASGNNRKLTAFIGGLDLCDGRYDTPEHRLFKDLNTVFENDIHNPTFPVSGYSTCIQLSAFLILMHGKICTDAVSLHSSLLFQFVTINEQCLLFAISRFSKLLLILFHKKSTLV